MITEEERDLLREMFYAITPANPEYRPNVKGGKALSARSDEEIRAMITLFKADKKTALNKQKLAIQAQLDILTVDVQPVNP